MRSLCPARGKSLPFRSERSEMRKGESALRHFREDEKDGAMFREHAKPRVGVAEIYERRRVNYL
jgi:hypothetical protein